MSIDFRSENSFPHPPTLGNLRFSPQNLKDFNAGAGFSRIYRPYQHREELPEILRKLHSFKPLCCSVNQRELARKALIAIKNRNSEDIRNLANNLANDVAGAVD
jgi:hypothetical protein